MSLKTSLKREMELAKKYAALKAIVDDTGKSDAQRSAALAQLKTMPRASAASRPRDRRDAVGRGSRRYTRVLGPALTPTRVSREDIEDAVRRVVS